MRYGITALLIGTLVIAGCGTYSFEGAKYSTQEQAFSAQQQLIRNIYAGITPVREKIGGRLDVCFPDSDSIYENATVGGAIGRKYVAKIFEEDYKTIVEVIKLRGAFDEVAIARTKGERCAARDDAKGMLYLYMPSTKLSQWYFTNKKIEKEQINFDYGEQDLAIRYSKFSSKIESLARASD